MYETRGFTLIELSIVIVIIGLVVGGVLVGRDLIRAAELRSIMTDWQRFETAGVTFRLKYNCMAGDCANASNFGLGSNGNGNQLLESPMTNAELWQYWQHMGTAGLIEGSFTGVHGPNAPAASYDAVIGSNVPASRISGVGYSLDQIYPIFTTWYND